jgi:hypothetical protein
MPVAKIKHTPFLTRVDVAILLVVIAVLLCIGATVKFVLQKDTYVTAELIAWGGDWWWNVAPPYYWNTHDVKVGAKAYDAFHKTDVEVLEVERNEESNHTFMFLKVRLLVKKNALTGTYSFHQSPLQVGATINIAPDNISLAGNIVGIDGVTSIGKEQYIVMQGKLFSGEDNAYGLRQYYRQEDADRFVVGDQTKDSNGHVVAEILDKVVEPAHIVTQNLAGDPLLRQSPLYKEITLKIRLRVIQSGPTYFYNFYQSVRPGEMLNLQLNNVWSMVRILSVTPENGASL